MNKEAKFAVVKLVGMAPMDPDAVLAIAERDGADGLAEAERERRGRYFAADVTAGEPQAGDLVYARQLPE